MRRCPSWAWYIGASAWANASAAAWALSFFASSIFTGMNNSARLIRRIGEHDRGFDLPLWNGPVGLQKRPLALRRYQRKAVAFVKTDRPGRRGPGADQRRLCAHLQ